MKVLVAGFGSIAKRHIRNLLSFSEIQHVYVFTQMTPQWESSAQMEKVSFLTSLEGCPRVDFAVVANQTHHHIQTALFLAEKNIPLFLEKPIAVSFTEDVQKLLVLVQSRKLPTLVAFNLRFLPVIKKIKTLLWEGAIGKLFFANLEVGQYLPEWRPQSDYRKSYSAIREKGGGVSLDLCHEIDYMCYFFGEPESWKVFKSKVSDLEINTEDLFEGLYLFENQMVCRVHLDYLEREKRRLIRIVGSKGEIFCDLFGKVLTLTTKSENQTWNEDALFDFGPSYISEMRHFLNVVSGRESSCPDIQQGALVLRLIEEQCLTSDG